jgi:voltage-dependent potassium channel beta subunit
MEYRFLGSSGLKISALSFGTWITFSDQVDEDTALACLQTAYEAGVNFFDTSENYGRGRSEIVLGQAIKKAGWKRSDLVISTKIFWGGEGPNDRGLSRKHLVEGAMASLARLQLDYVDLLFCHRPDSDTPIEETVRAMNFLIDQGRAFYWGTSQWSAQQIMEAYAVARREHLIPPQMEQPLYNMLNRDRVEREYARLYHEIGLGTTIFSPLAIGVLTGKYNDGIPEGTRADLENFDWLLRDRFQGDEAQRDIEKVKQLLPIAAELGCTMAQLALAWCLRNPNVSSVITGASKPAQVSENIKALDVVAQLDDEINERIEAILDNRPALEPQYR